MTWKRSLSQVGLPLVAGIWIGLGLASLESTDSPDGLPNVGDASAWGQHTPRLPVSEAGPEALIPGQPPANVPSELEPDGEAPRVHESAFLDPMSSVVGNVEIGDGVYVAPFASVRGAEGQLIHFGTDSNLQDGVVVHALQTVSKDRPIQEARYSVGGKIYTVYVGERVSLAHQSQVHGPAWIEDDVYVGMQALVFRSHIGKGAIVEPGATIIGVNVPPGHYVPARAVITSQEAADRLPEITYSYGLRELNRAMLKMSRNLTAGHGAAAAASDPR